MVLVEILTKRDCCLCKEAKRILDEVRGIIPFELREVDIEGDEDLLRRYGEEIPLIFINGRKSFKYRVDKKRLIERIKKEGS